MLFQNMGLYASSTILQLVRGEDEDVGHEPRQTNGSS